MLIAPLTALLIESRRRVRFTKAAFIMEGLAFVQLEVRSKIALVRVSRHCPNFRTPFPYSDHKIKVS